MSSVCLVLGPEGTGKTLLLEKLCSQVGQKGRGRRGAATRDASSGAGLLGGVDPTIPTTGTNVKELKFDKRLSCSLREHGGIMAPVWNTAYGNCHMVAYVVDTSRPTQISAATVLLLELFSSEALKNKPFLLFFNKVDSPFTMSLVEMKSIMRLDDIVATIPHKVTIVHGSCVSGEGLEDVLEWLRTNTAGTQSSPED